MTKVSLEEQRKQEIIDTLMSKSYKQIKQELRVALAKVKGSEK